MNAANLFFALATSGQPSSADAVILLEGDGYTRIKKACSLIKEGWADTLVFSGGITDLNYGSYPYEWCLPKILEEGITPESIIHESASQNTREQAENIISICQHKGWKHIILVATHYHQYRAFLTFLKVLEQKGILNELKMSSVPAMANWFEQTPWGIREELLKSEIRKIEEYKAKGHISEYQTAIEYFRKWSGN